MIRREESGRWILISQIDHAHLSGRLAEHWGAGGVAPLVARDELLWAISHHDDGWRRWEQSPDIEPKFVRPRSFMEMELAVSLDIWAQSIAAAAQHGPLAGYTVAGHFCALLRRFGSSARIEPRADADADRFLATYESLLDGCLRAWQGRSPGENTPERAHLALSQLQMFDSLSLWFCCEEASQSNEFQTPAGPVVTLAPQKRPGRDEPHRVLLSPWPFTVERLNLEVPGRAIPARRYENRTELAAAPAQRVVLRWELLPAEPA
jgi:hypothetical protein